MKLICLFAMAGMLAFAQSIALRGQVTDESGAVIPGAKVTLTGPSGITRTAVAGVDGSYSFTNLLSGSYTVTASAPGLVLRQAAKISATAGSQTLNLLLHVATEKQEVTVEESGGPTVGTEASANASAIVLRGSDLDALSDNPDDLTADLQALAGPAAGPNGGSMFIDGFSGGQLPPKSAIREIRINQNPFSPEYDKLGFGRIEIFTKPGTGDFRGSLGYNFANDKWNTRNPYAQDKAPFHLNELSGTLSGPINRRSSFNVNLISEWVDNGNVINGVTLDSQTLTPGPFTGFALAAMRRIAVTPRIDYQLAQNHTLSVRYAYNTDEVNNAGTGGLNLLSRGYRNEAPSHTVQLTETSVLGASVVNETRFQSFRAASISAANSQGSAIQVLGAFNGGGNPVGHSTDIQNNYELQNYTSVVHRAHAWRFGVRFRGILESSTAPQNFAGTFTFSGGLAPRLDSQNNAVVDSAGQPVLIAIDSIESYRRTLLFQGLGLPAAQIRLLGGGATQFSINAGNPTISGSQFDVGAFIGDDWKIRPNVTLSLGLRYETQNDIHDRRDFAPRIGVAWALGPASGKSRPKSVIRAGFGMFYDRFSLANSLAAQRYNGVIQQQYVIANPDFFPVVPPVASLAGFASASVIQKISSTLRAPHLMQSALAFERQMPLSTTIAITYANSHGVHMLRSQDINAALPGSGMFPLGRTGPVFLMESAGLYNQNQVILNVNSKVNRSISLTGVYMYNRAMSNTDGLGTLPANPYSMEGEYGPAVTDIHHRAALSGTVTALWGIRFNPLLTLNSGPPYDITAGRDLYGDTLFNARPGIATDAAKPGVVRTQYGLLDPNPTPGETLLGRNAGRGPGQVMFNMRVGKTFGFGRSREDGAAPVGGGGGGGRGTPASPFSLGGGGGGQGGGAAPANRRYSFTISMQIRNITNHNNPGPIIGNITSPLFGQANQPAGSGNGIFSESANNRRLELQTRFTF